MLEIYCYNRCSTCQKAITYLLDNKIDFELRDIVGDHPNYDEMNDIIKRSGKSIEKFFNTSGILYREEKLKDKLPKMSYEEKLTKLVSDGKLIKRPLLVSPKIVLNGFSENEWSLLKK